MVFMVVCECWSVGLHKLGNLAFTIRLDESNIYAKRKNNNNDQRTAYFSASFYPNRCAIDACLELNSTAQYKLKETRYRVSLLHSHRFSLDRIWDWNLSKHSTRQHTHRAKYTDEQHTIGFGIKNDLNSTIYIKYSWKTHVQCVETWQHTFNTEMCN